MSNSEKISRFFKFDFLNKPTFTSPISADSKVAKKNSTSKKASEDSTKTNENNLVEIGTDFVKNANDTTTKTLKADNFKDWCIKQNYVAGNVISKGFSFDKLNGINDSYDEVMKNKEMGPTKIESKLSEEEQKEMREYAIQLLENRIKENKENMPDYGDCKDYYNEGSLTDWLIPGGHPVAFAIKGISPEAYEKMSFGENGMLSLMNIGSCWEDYAGEKTENDVRKDHATDMLGDFRSIENIEKDIASKEEWINELKRCIDDPEAFAAIYYKATEGMNFSPDKVKEYKLAKENNEETIAENSILGRNYIAEDISKNEIGTNVEFELNKTAGTILCKFIPVGGSMTAFGVNTGVTILEEATKENSDLDFEKVKNIAIKEGLRSFSITKADSISNIFKQQGWSKGAANWTTKAALQDASSVVKPTSEYSAKDWAWLGAETLLNPATLPENALKVVGGIFAS